ncbi:MAG: hypothetical protein BWK80_47700 [Desulfobacteraceae bacterium IS3]|nr:MAG: hypothetical protein BWK80_47700 [Desulfobacteraceae bacterium IS3]
MLTHFIKFGRLAAHFSTPDNFFLVSRSHAPRGKVRSSEIAFLHSPGADAERPAAFPRGALERDEILNFLVSRSHAPRGKVRSSEIAFLHSPGADAERPVCIPTRSVGTR